MAKILRWIIGIPAAAFLLAFSVANRHSITLFIDPLGLLGAPIFFSAPLFVHLFLALFAGIALGWLFGFLSSRARRGKPDSAQPDREGA